MNLPFTKAQVEGAVEEYVKAHPGCTTQSVLLHVTKTVYRGYHLNSTVITRGKWARKALNSHINLGKETRHAWYHKDTLDSNP